MDGIALLGEARAVGLTVEADGDRLRIRGPASAGDVARRLLDRKAAVLRALDQPDEVPVVATAQLGDEVPVGQVPDDGPETSTPDALPVGWPDDVPRPDWWPELTAAVDVLAARRCPCPGCGFSVAVLWAGPGGARWSCPACGLDSPEADVPGWDDLDAPDGWTCPTCGGLSWWEDCGSLERSPVRRCVRCDGDGLARSNRLVVADMKPHYPDRRTRGAAR